MDTVISFSRDQKVAALKREIALRRNVYAKQVRNGRMTQTVADREIGVMQAILQDYEMRSRKSAPGQ